MAQFKDIELTSILRFGLTYDKISPFDIICLPENLVGVTNPSELYDASDAITLSKLLKAEGVKCANSFDLNLEALVFERRSKEKWFGIVYIRNNVVIPVFVSVIATLIANEITESSKSKDPTQPVPQVHIELKLEKINSVTTLKYDGDAQTLISILKTLEADTVSTE